jgi:hypothetical protein
MVRDYDRSTGSGDGLRYRRDGDATDAAPPLQQLRPCLGDPEQVAPARLPDRGREPIAGQRRDHQVEGVGRVAAVAPGVGERADDPQELHRRARPAVGDQQRQRVGLERADMQEVDRLPVDDGDELRELVQHRLLLAPVEAVGPVAGQLLEVVEGHPPAPADAGQLGGPAGAGQPLAQVVQVLVGNGDPERPDLGVARVGHGEPPPTRTDCSIPL